MPKLWIWLDKELRAQLMLLAKQHNMDLQSYIKVVLKKHVEGTSSPSQHLLSQGDVKSSPLQYLRNNISITNGDDLNQNLTFTDGDVKSSPSERGSDPPEGKRVSIDELVQKLADLLEKRLSRKIQDQLNASTSKVEHVAQKQAEVIERLEALEERVERLEEAVAEKRARGAKSSTNPQKPRASMCEQLAEDKVLFESEIANRIRNRDAFFAKIESKCGGIVVEGAKERVAVEKGFWQSFLDKLSKIDTSDEEKVKKTLDALEYKLFKVLKESALIIFDTTTRKWIFVEKRKTGPSSGTDAGTAPPGASTTNSTAGGATATSSSTKASTSQRKKHYKKRYGGEDESWLLQYVDNVA